MTESVMARCIDCNQVLPEAHRSRIQRSFWVLSVVASAMSCPYSKEQQAAAVAEKPAGKCPYVKPTEAPEEPAKCPAHAHHGALAEGDEMCSHARKKLERERLANEAAGEETGEKRHLPQQDWKSATGDELKSHFAMAYNMVADDVAKRSRANTAKIAGVLVRRLGYTEEDMRVIGDDSWVMQGTGNPHVMAAIQPGETVVDFGSGFGMDAFIAASRVGETGRVTGIDLSIGEVTAAIKRASARRLRNVDFRLGDMEDVPVADATTDAVISNGGFCLVPDKAKSFREIYRILKPGGRFTISCTTLRKELDPQYNWPSCFVVFMPLNTVESMLHAIGFTDVVIDDSNARMDLWDEAKKQLGEEDPEAVKAAEEREKKATIHSGNPEFDFLKKMDMNEYCARVNIRAVKPSA
jgi:SAM-dependent methyltransferase